MATKIKRFNLKDDADVSNVPENSHLSFIHKDAVREVSKKLHEDISVHIGFPENLSKWDDFNFVIVIDHAFGQPYTPFYRYLSEECELFPCLEIVVEEYNKFMSSLPYLEEIKVK